MAAHDGKDVSGNNQYWIIFTVSLAKIKKLFPFAGNTILRFHSLNIVDIHIKREVIIIAANTPTMNTVTMFGKLK